jgi:putative membrane protein
MIMNKNTIYYLSQKNKYNPTMLKMFGPHALEKIKLTNECKYVADLMINSFYDTTVDEVAAFEEQIGSHGGMGGKQSFPFVFFPKQWYFPRKEILGAEKLHLLLKQWLLDIKDPSLAKS